MRGRKIKLREGTALFVQPHQATGTLRIQLYEDGFSSHYYLTCGEATRLISALSSAVVTLRKRGAR